MDPVHGVPPADLSVRPGQGGRRQGRGEDKLQVHSRGKRPEKAFQEKRLKGRTRGKTEKEEREIHKRQKREMDRQQ